MKELLEKINKFSVQENFFKSKTTCGKIRLCQENAVKIPCNAP